MERFDRMSLKKWMGPAAGALALAGLLAVLSTAVLGAFEDGAQAPEVIHRTARPATETRTPTVTLTPTITLTPSETPTPTLTPTPFPTKDVAEIGNTVLIGGSTGDEFLSTSGVSYVPMFDGGVSGSFAGAGHVVLPGAITHLTVRLTSPVDAEDGFIFSISINGKKSNVTCTVPAKGKGDFCEAGDKVGDCVEAGPQDTMAVQVVPSGTFGGQSAGSPGLYDVQMSWSAKLDLYGECPAPYIGLNSCQGEGSACVGATGHIGSNSCNGSVACVNAIGNIGDNSCNGLAACVNSSGNIGNGSCDAVQACVSKSGSVGNGSCNAQLACASNSGAIGDNQCNVIQGCFGP
jgi:hypothetical protein